MLFEERSHQLIGFFGFGERGIVPERVGQRFENDELRVNSGVEISTMENRRAAEQQIASASDKESWRKAGKVGVHGRQHRIVERS